MSKTDNTGKDGNGRRLFRWTQGYNNAVLNSTGDPEAELALYGDAFHRAAQVLLKHMPLRGSMNSFDVCPIIFLYRQSLELYLKSIIVHGNRIRRLDGKDEVGVKDILETHSLTRLLAGAGPIICDEMSWKDKFEKVGGYTEFEYIVNEFHTIDPGSYAFRYPVNKEGEGSVAPNFPLDVRNIADRLDPILKLLWAAADSLDDYYRNMCEQIGEARQDAMVDDVHLS